MSDEMIDFNSMAQELTMDLTLPGAALRVRRWGKDLRRLSMRLPNAYRWIPFQGR